MLVFDQKHFEVTGVYTLIDPEDGVSFTFADALEAKEFIDAYYSNNLAAIFAYTARRYVEGLRHAR